MSMSPLLRGFKKRKLLEKQWVGTWSMIPLLTRNCKERVPQILGVFSFILLDHGQRIRKSPLKGEEGFS